MLAANGFRIEHWQRDRLRELMSWPNPFDELADRESRMAARAAESMADLGRVAMRVQDAIQMAAATYSRGPSQTHWLSDEVWAAAVDDELEPETPQQRALPRPSTTPPMWAVQPNRRNRRRNR
ncbi:hypothetical protein GS881_15620 [Rhodococcus hoagii]|nr:hypothetical protein [Prescottella equi]